MIHLGLTIYVWGLEPQNRLLVDGLGPLVSELEADDRVARFWFDRYDARGMHLFVVLTVPESQEEAVRRIVAERLDDFLREHPSTVEMSRRELQKRHEECRGRLQCEADGYPGLAENNTWEMFRHPPDGMPFRLADSLEAPLREELWDLLDELSLESIERLSSTPKRRTTAPGVAWIAGVDAALREQGIDPEGYWRFHASTLLLNLEQRLQEDEATILASLPRLIGEQNLETLGTFWERVSDSRAIWPSLPRLTALAHEAARNRSDRPWLPLRAIDHAVLKQLGLLVPLHMPIVLYAWHRSLES